MSDLHYDGDFVTPYQVGPAIPSVDPDTRARITKVPFWIRAAYYQPLPRGSRAAGIDGFLVDQPEPRPVGADLVEFDLIFAQVPSPRVELEPWVYSFQYRSNGELAEFPQACTSRVAYSYVHTADPTTIPLAVAFKAVTVGDEIGYVGALPAYGSYVLAEDEQLRRWRGDIWEIQSRTVPYQIALKRI